MFPEYSLSTVGKTNRKSRPKLTPLVELVFLSQGDWILTQTQ